MVQGRGETCRGEPTILQSDKEEWPIRRQTESGHFYKTFAYGLTSLRGPCEAPGCSMSMRKSCTIIFNKPYDVLPCFTDPEGRPTLADYIDVQGVYAAGRLDRDSEGLMILTSDGGLAHRITDPRHKLAKVYWVQVERVPDESTLARLRRGVMLSGIRTRPAEVRLLPSDPALAERPVPIR